MNSFVDFGLALRERALQVLAILAFGTLITVTYVSQLPKEYTAFVQISVEANLSPAGSASETSQQRALRHQKSVESKVFSRAFLEQVIAELSDEKKLATAETRSALSVKTLREQLTILPLGGAREAWQPQAVPVGLVVSVTLPDPDLAVYVANRIATAFLSFDKKIRLDRAEAQLRFFNQGADKVGEQLAAIESEIGKFKVEHAMELPSAISALRDRIVELDADVTLLDRRKASLEANSESASRVRELQQANQLRDILAERNLLISRRTEIYEQLRSIPSNEKHLNALSRKRDQLASQVAAAFQRTAEANLNVDMAQSEWLASMSISELSQQPRVNHVEGRNKKYGLGFVLTFGLAALYVFLLEIRRPTVRTSSQLERAMGITPLVAISHVPSSSEAIATKLTWISFFALVALVGYGSFMFL
ncbi:hypothetical protein KO498_12740 [Lentibacter algarum]|uniref:hypothetical protein n=1 Tax=Lentibacter algarum TaxID=576131 RepID=UPI001C0A4EDB|nr:hypothetical protein [Lentibacter algarum]MBU2982676.1 hypothetical protein [Lentibacter algarum]